MNEFLSIFLSWQFILLCVGIAAVTFLVRTLVEHYILNNPKMPGNSSSKFWRDVFLVVFPVLLGFVFPVVAKTFTYPEALQDHSSKFLFAASAGLLSPTLYRVIKALLWKNVSDSAAERVSQENVTTNTAGDSNPPESQV